MSSKGNLIVISAPSGSGKTSLTKRVLQEIPEVTFSVSHTTRKPRRGEVHGQEYFFVSEQEFRQMIERQDFLEYAHVYENYYGTGRDFVECELDSGSDVLLDIDVQGAMKVKANQPQAVLIFLLPPSLEVLEARLRGRGLDDEHVIAKRLRFAREELQHCEKYHYLVVNQEIENSFRELRAIILANRREPEFIETATRCAMEERTLQARAIVETFEEN